MFSIKAANVKNSKHQCWKIPNISENSPSDSRNSLKNVGFSQDAKEKFTSSIPFSYISKLESGESLFSYNLKIFDLGQNMKNFQKSPKKSH